MKFEILMACMHQTDTTLVQTNQIHTNVLLINQSDQETMVVEPNPFNPAKTVRFITCQDRGLSNSRNMALSHAKGEICLIGDDDVTYVPDLEARVLAAFEDCPEADIIAFNFVPVNHEEPVREYTQIRETPRRQFHASVRLAFRLNKVRQHNLWFNPCFGAGGLYSSGEESLWLKAARDAGLIVYDHVSFIGQVDYAASTWRQGYNEKYFFDKGAFIAAAYPRLQAVMLYYFVWRLRHDQTLTAIQKVKRLHQGRRAYKHRQGYPISQDVD